MRESQLIWFSHMQQRLMIVPMKSKMMQVEGAKKNKRMAKIDLD